MVLVVWRCLGVDLFMGFFLGGVGGGGDLLGALLGRKGDVRVGKEKEDLTKTQPGEE
jgi:hypothetical protein